MYRSEQNWEALTTLGLGYHVVRASDTLPQTTTETLFTVAGGRCLVTLMYGKCVDTVFSATDPQIDVLSNPTTGTSTALASTLDSKDLEVNGYLVVEGDGSALVKSTAGGIIFAVGQRRCVVPVGEIQLHSLASQTGSMEWHLWYVPLDDGAYIVEA